MGEDTSIIVGPVKEKIRSFERKHGCNLETFEDRLKQLPEDFERWDDFIEWKAYADSVNYPTLKDGACDCTKNRVTIGWLTTALKAMFIAAM
jgi:hypothetical protein